MTKEKALKIAERNLKKAEMTYKHNYNRQGVTEQEKENIVNNLEYAKFVLDMIEKLK